MPPLEIPPHLYMVLSVQLDRHRVGRCDNCGLRRVRYSLAILGAGETPKLCAPCAGIRP